MTVTAKSVQELAEMLERRDDVRTDFTEAVFHLAEDLRNEEAAAAAPAVPRLYRVVLSQHANYVVDVHATSPAEAKERAEADAYAGLCNECSRQIDLDPCNWGAIDEDPEIVGDVVDCEVVDDAR